MERNQVKLISDGFFLQQLGVGLGFPNRDWGQVAVVKTPDPSCSISGQWPGPRSPSAAEKEFPQRQKAVKQVNKMCFLFFILCAFFLLFIKKEKEYKYMWINTWADSGRESYRIKLSSVKVWILLWSISSWASFGDLLPKANFAQFAWFTLHIWYIQDPPMCELASSAKMDFSERHMGREYFWYNSPLTSMTFFQVYLVREVSWLRKELCGLQVPTSSHCLLFVSSLVLPLQLSW